jgi:hypothetical protein
VVGLTFAALGGFAPAHMMAQDYNFQPRLQWELRADGLPGAGSAVQLGGGANIPAGYYLRVGVAAAAGPIWRDDRAAPSARVDFVARYLLDPFREIRSGLYAGAGFTSRWDDATHWRGYLLVVAGLEGAEMRGWRPAIEVGLGGGARVSVVLRRARRNGR